MGKFVFAFGSSQNFSKDPISSFKPSGSNGVPQTPYGSIYMLSFLGK
jgi:hypothetical protein